MSPGLSMVAPSSAPVIVETLGNVVKHVATEYSRAEEGALSGHCLNVYINV